MGSSGTWSALSFSSMTAVRRPQAWESLLPLTRDRVRTWIRRHPPPGKPFCQIDLGGDGMANQRTGFFETLRFGVRGAYPNNTEAIVNIRISERINTSACCVQKGYEPSDRQREATQCHEVETVEEAEARVREARGSG